MNEIKALIGDYEVYSSHLFKQVEASGIDITGRPLSHLQYRPNSMDEYRYLRDELKKFSREFVETSFNDSHVSILILKDPLPLYKNFTVNVLELPSPKFKLESAGSLEAINIIIGNELPAFISKYKDIITGIKNYGPHSQPAFIQYDEFNTVKFYNLPLRTVVELQGWKFESLT